MQRDFRTTFAEWTAARAQRQARVRRIDAELDWKTWARHRLALYWYGLLAVFADIAIVATILSVLPRPLGPLGYGTALAFTLPVLYLEWELYRLLFPSEEAVLEAAERRRAGAAARAARPPANREAPLPSEDGSARGEGPPPET